MFTAPHRTVRRIAAAASVAALSLVLAFALGALERRGAERTRIAQWSADGRLGGLTVTERPATRPASGARRTLTVVATGDLKGWIDSTTLYPRRRPGGLAYLAPLLRELRARDPQLVLLDAGDALRGAPSATLLHEAVGLPPLELPAVAAMNALGYDAMALGNVDLGLGWAALAHAESGSDFRWLSANLERDDGGTRLAPYAVLERDDGQGALRIGVLGLTTPAAALGRPPSELAGLRFADLQAAARHWVPVLREVERVDVLIGLFHSGLDEGYGHDRSLRSGLPAFAAAGRIAAEGLGFDLIVAGDAQRLEPREPSGAETPWGAPVLEPGAHGNGLAVATLNLAEHGGRWRVVDVRRETRLAASQPDPAVPAPVAAALERTRAALAEPTAVRFRAVPRKGEFYRCAGALSHAVAEGLEGGSGALSLLPMRWRFAPPGRDAVGTPLRRADLYRWMAYGERLVRVSLTGRQVALLLEGYVRHLRGWRVWSPLVLWPGGLEAAPAAEGSALATLRRAGDDAPLEPHARYPVWLSAFVWYGGLGLAPRALLPGGPPERETASTLREALFARLSEPAFTIPAHCARWLEH